MLLGCSCCSAEGEMLETAARNLSSRTKRERSHWAAGRVGDIDFVGSTKTKGKVDGSLQDTQSEDGLHNPVKNVQDFPLQSSLLRSSLCGWRATQTQRWSSRCWQRSGVWLLHTWWWHWWVETSWLRWNPGSGTRSEKALWRPHRARVRKDEPHRALTCVGKSVVKQVLCCLLLTGNPLEITTNEVCVVLEYTTSQFDD